MLVPRASLALLSLVSPTFAFVQQRPYHPVAARLFAPTFLHAAMGEHVSEGKGAIVAEASALDAPSTSVLNHVSGIREVAASHSVFLLDMWGVMHDGTNPYDGALESVKKLNELGKKMVILSNSSKRIGNSHKMLRKLGFDPEDFDGIITSGEVSFRMLCGDGTLECETWPVLRDLLESDERKAFVLGSGDGDEEYCSSAGWEIAPLNVADLIVARGTFTINDGSGNVVSKIEDEDNYFRVLDEALATAARKGVPMLVTNPDRVRPDEGLPPMPGAIGDSYEEALASEGREDPASLVKRIGKPFGEVYELAMNRVGEDGWAGGVCMVGDALETDITGGSRASCSTLWVVKDGIHASAVEEICEESYERGAAEVLDQFNRGKGYTNGDALSPTFVTPYFKW